MTGRPDPGSPDPARGGSDQRGADPWADLYPVGPALAEAGIGVALLEGGALAPEAVAACWEERAAFVARLAQQVGSRHDRGRPAGRLAEVRWIPGAHPLIPEGDLPPVPTRAPTPPGTLAAPVVPTGALLREGAVVREPALLRELAVGQERAVGQELAVVQEPAVGQEPAPVPGGARSDGHPHSRSRDRATLAALAGLLLADGPSPPRIAHLLRRAGRAPAAAPLPVEWVLAVRAAVPGYVDDGRWEAPVGPDLRRIAGPDRTWDGDPITLTVVIATDLAGLDARFPITPSQRILVVGGARCEHLMLPLHTPERWGRHRWSPPAGAAALQPGPELEANLERHAREAAALLEADSLALHSISVRVTGPATGALEAALESLLDRRLAIGAATSANQHSTAPHGNSGGTRPEHPGRSVGHPEPPAADAARPGEHSAPAGVAAERTVDPGVAAASGPIPGTAPDDPHPALTALGWRRWTSPRWWLHLLRRLLGR